jgi:hypothetical protein
MHPSLMMCNVILKFYFDLIFERNKKISLFNEMEIASHVIYKIIKHIYFFFKFQMHDI